MKTNNLEVKGFKYLNQCISKLILGYLCTNNTLIKLLKYNNRDELKEALKDDTIEFSRDEILEEYIFPYKFRPDFDGEIRHSIHVKMGKTTFSGNRVFKDSKLMIHILVDISRINGKTTVMIDGGNRDVEIMHEIDTMLSNECGFGLQGLELLECDPIDTDKLTGFTMVYNINTIH